MTIGSLRMFHFVPSASKYVFCFFFQLTCIIVENEEDIAAFKNYVDDSSTTKSQSSPVQAQATPPVAPPKPIPASSPATPAQSSLPSSPASFKSTDRLFASPLAKKLAAEKGFDLSVRCSLYAINVVLIVPQN